MNNENKTNEVQNYLFGIWQKPSEMPTKKKGNNHNNIIPIMVMDGHGNIASYNFVSDDMDWKDVVKDENVMSWCYYSDILPGLRTPNLKDYKSILSYEDACIALGEGIDEKTLKKAGVPKHIIAQMKLELICKALWGGEVKVYPDPDGNRIYWYPVLALYNQSEIDGMSDKERGCLLSAVAAFWCGCGFRFSGCGSSFLLLDCAQWLPLVP